MSLSFPSTMSSGTRNFCSCHEQRLCGPTNRRVSCWWWCGLLVVWYENSFLYVHLLCPFVPISVHIIMFWGGWVLVYIIRDYRTSEEIFFPLEGRKILLRAPGILVGSWLFQQPVGPFFSPWWWWLWQEVVSKVTHPNDLMKTNIRGRSVSFPLFVGQYY